MKKLIGLSTIALGIFLEILWIGFCFGSVVIGILLLIFAPRILFFPFNFFLVLGLSIMDMKKFQQNPYHKYQYNNFKSSSNINNHNKYYEILESKEDDSIDTIKKNYRRLIKKYHYDSIASQDLSKDMINLAKEKTQILNEAYSIIKEKRK